MRADALREARATLYLSFERSGFRVPIRALCSLASAGYTPQRLRSATTDELKALPGIGDTLSRRLADRDR